MKNFEKIHNLTLKKAGYERDPLGPRSVTEYKISYSS